MKKAGLVFGFIFVFMVSSASAELIGVRDVIGDQYPDIIFNNTGEITYSVSSNTFVLSADDLKIAYNNSTYDWLSGPGLLTTLSIGLDIDQSGQLIGTGAMVEEVVQGEVHVGNMTYGVGTVILSGTVYDFGWAESGAELGWFDFLVKDVSGALVDDLLWPSGVPTGIIAFAEDITGWDGGWNADFHLKKVKGDKAPIVPEPATICLLGLGGLLLRRRKSA